MHTPPYIRTVYISYNYLAKRRGDGRLGGAGCDFIRLVLPLPAHMTGSIGRISPVVLEWSWNAKTNRRYYYCYHYY